MGRVEWGAMGANWGGGVVTLRPPPIMKFERAIQALYAARRPLTRKRRMSHLSDQDAETLESIEAALDVLEMAEHFRLTRKTEP